MLTDTYHCNLLQVIERNVEADEHLQTHPGQSRGDERQGSGGRIKPYFICYLASLHSFPATEARVKGSTSGFWRAVLEQPGEGGGMKAEGL